MWQKEGEFYHQYKSKNYTDPVTYIIHMIQLLKVMLINGYILD